MAFLPLVLCAIPAVVLYYIIRYYRWVATFPKGPTPMPFIGNLLQVKATHFHEELPRLAKTYGSVFTVFIPIPIVVLADYDSVKEAFVVRSDDFSDRPGFGSQSEFAFCENPGVIQSNGESWRQNRRAAIHILRDFGMGKNLMEEQVKCSVEEYLRCLDAIEDKSAVIMRWPIQLMVANIINETLFGFRYAYDDAAPLVEYVESFNAFVRIISSSWLRFAAVILRKIPALANLAFSEQRTALYNQQQYIIRNVDRALKTYSSDGEPECFVHVYKKIMGSAEFLTHENMLATCSDFFLAGQETTTTTLRWAMLFLAREQDVQDHLRSEILAVVGRDRLPSMADRPRMPYTSACIVEIQRLANIIQTSVMHKTRCDTEVMGHKIPAATNVNGDLHMILSTDPLFERPAEFRPERFLAEDGKSLNKALVDRSIPFGIGKRQCAGEGLAKVELFLGLTATIQRYRILPSSEAPIDLTPEPYVVLLPKEQLLRLETV